MSLSETALESTMAAIDRAGRSAKLLLVLGLGKKDDLQLQGIVCCVSVAGVPRPRWYLCAPQPPRPQAARLARARKGQAGDLML